MPIQESANNNSGMQVLMEDIGLVIVPILCVLTTGYVVFCLVKVVKDARQSRNGEVDWEVRAFFPVCILCLILRFVEAIFLAVAGSDKTEGYEIRIILLATSCCLMLAFAFGIFYWCEILAHFQRRRDLSFVERHSHGLVGLFARHSIALYSSLWGISLLFFIVSFTLAIIFSRLSLRTLLLCVALYMSLLSLALCLIFAVVGRFAVNQALSIINGILKRQREHLAHVDFVCTLLAGAFLTKGVLVFFLEFVIESEVVHNLVILYDIIFSEIVPAIAVSQLLSIHHLRRSRSTVRRKQGAMMHVQVGYV
eukprot:TRINITY_DN3013_c0_g1_i2.p1 TRINITY_DN3013_c0_g1~~TRINITY_DN3013_c0_g1_i2.p1  ORF type:complete len:309 (-),score=36.74 TRINITY_DN3013_c0_g1_i2:100-1026(-)